MANSSDWLDLLLERPEDESPQVKPVSWLAELSGGNQETGPNHVSADGFVGGLPFGRPDVTPDLMAKPDSSTDDDARQLEGSAHPSNDMTGDALVDILREALGENEGGSGAQHPFDAVPAAPPTAQGDPALETPPDPIAEAHARGLTEGRQQGRQEALEQQDSDAQHKLQLRHTFRALDQAAMDALASELGDTVIALCAQTLADYAPDAAALQARCTHAAQRLGKRASGAVLSLHPDDLALIDETSLAAWTVVGDPATERGGLRFETEDGSISDRPSDWRRAIAAAIRG